MPKFFHGTTLAKIASVLEQGLKRPKVGYTPDTVSLAVRPDTARGYAAMGGESAFREARARSLKSIPMDERRVVQVNLPDEWYSRHFDRELYPDSPLREVRVGADIPPNYLKVLSPEEYRRALLKKLKGVK